MNDVLTPEEIKEIRGLYGLTQKSFAQLLGLGTASIVRYEQGVVPSKANANLIRAARHPQFVKECLEREGSSLPESQRNKATEIVYALVSLEPEEGGNTMIKHQLNGDFQTEMDRVYHYTLQQEVLNEQAANIIGEIISIKISTGFSGSANSVYETLLDQVAEMKPSIVSKESMDDLILERIGGYLACANDLVNRYELGVA